MNGNTGNIDPSLQQYRSIVEEKGLNFCLDKDNNTPKPTPKAESPLKYIQQTEP